ncbi:MAG: glycosyltransferase [Deltaproteobacteria bacterium]|nr:glycosyltransferase [Deltaproteobacteria bacterium]
MITHVFHSTVVSGPETLVIPALKNIGEPVTIVFLSETRVQGGATGPVEYARALGHEVHSVPVRGRWDRKAFKELRELLDRLKPRVVHAHDVKASLYLMKAAQARPDFVPGLVSTHHGAVARSGIIRLYEEFYVRYVLPYFDATMCVCEGDIASLSRRGLPLEKLHLHINGVERPMVAAAARIDVQRSVRNRWKQAVEAIPGPNDALVVGAVARLSGEKRHDRMIHAMATVKRKLAPRRAVLLCFGIGAEEAKLKELTKAAGLEDTVFWMGYSKTIGSEMAGFDLLLCLSDGEGIPINLLEAGWAGTPVFSTRVGGIPDVLSNPQVGYLVDKSESDETIGAMMAETLADYAGRARVGEAYQRHVIANFSERAWLATLKKVYDGI